MSERTGTAAVQDLQLRIDGREALSADWVAAVHAVCDGAEDHAGRARITVRVSGTPDAAWTDGLTVSLVNKWERALRRLERVPSAVVAVAEGTVGGMALDVLLATDYRIAAGSLRLVLPVHDGATWPGMALYRLARHGAGVAAIRRAVLFGTPVEAAEALALRLVDEVADDPDHALSRLGARLSGLSGRELAVRRQLMSEAPSTSFEEALGAHLAACDRSLRRTDAGAAP
ncbi:enoyl-CoA hydratase/isomerase family protein [Streptomyces sp. TRM S81-3]|uniref:Enoyl-CoA hydratase/isomerase family protein n=1 Tax=Streptomyces griseicoloratus TaxID=2752516 RepID=A0A926L8D8_9ACTN|nr:enoyl-CoA-hydratase DpgB [Streptomyces griseicoloratus]MBD0423935.1 enoyl-CoA hydratase/isomerase family protein [Streptomyces griseicoloratus]